MNKLQPNPVTGFLESINPGTVECFTSDKKLKLLEVAKQYAMKRQLPDINLICDQIGITYRQFSYHLNQDSKFKAAWDDIRARVFSGLCNELSVKASSKNGIVANLAVLRYLESGTFNPESRVVHMSDNSTVKAVFDRITTYKDAEIVENDQITGSQGDMVDKSA